MSAPFSNRRRAGIILLLALLATGVSFPQWERAVAPVKGKAAFGQPFFGRPAWDCARRQLPALPPDQGRQWQARWQVPCGPAFHVVFRRA